ncbi:triose-phosphate isomerase [Pacificimonas flava]|uniref:Triosephosphate isomerase n=1 Tax=Pacificimonas flava TaxID=1234595 RepID=M2TDK0_9SPHN|nr:triose-phosphate isomerase [Pacificimonas flava]EMD84584.1 Triosephosphate isomerase [Pacificimonas flava]MBB5279547.1 triosephosphate isomerase [Pacificimonas flava]
MPDDRTVTTDAARSPFLGRCLIAGNWKMHGTSRDLGTIGRIMTLADTAGDDVGVALAVPHTLIFPAAQMADDSRLSVGGEDCHSAEKGAHTGCVSAPMLVDAGATFTLVGHSERRTDQGETDAEVRGKAEAARAAGLSVIICVGETEAERDGGEAEAVVRRQLEGSLPQGDSAGLAVAYEPVWAIGTGRTPTTADIAAMHDSIRSALTERFGAAGESILILYGGSVKPENAAELLSASNVGGALVGGASLDADSFGAIVRAA